MNVELSPRVVCPNKSIAMHLTLDLLEYCSSQQLFLKQCHTNYMHTSKALVKPSWRKIHLRLALIKLKYKVLNLIPIEVISYK